MNIKLKYFFSLMLIASGLYPSQGQTLKIAFLNSSSEETIPLENIKTVTFSENDEDLEVNQLNKTGVYSLSNIRKIYFGEPGIATSITTSFNKSISLFNYLSEEKIEITNNLQSPISIEIFDISGRRVHEQVLQEGTTTLSTSAYTQGLYLIKANDSTFKFVKQ
ncbi:MAG: T9SS type A sorting domain-containing protein [Sporocytophaga sp.]|nr:T9SS type A sorting domain-containing protein [Sporocytophaga sp.]